MQKHPASQWSPLSSTKSFNRKDKRHPHQDHHPHEDHLADDEDDDKLRCGYDAGFSASRNRFYSGAPGSLLSAIASPGRTFNKAVAALSSPSRDGKKMERPPPGIYPNILPHSGNLPSHPGPIKLHVNMQYVGGHSGSHNSRTADTIKASLIPYNAPGKVKWSAPENDTCEPSSPKVNCLGRVKIKQRYCKETGKLASITVAAQADKKHQPASNQLNVDLAWNKNPRRNKKEASIEEAGTASTEMGLQGTINGKKVAGMLRKSKDDLESLRLDKNGTWKSREVIADLKNHDRILRGGTMKVDAYSNDKVKKKGRSWRLKEASSHMRIGWHKQKEQSGKDEPSHAKLNCALDLSRFGSGQEGRLENCMVMDRSGNDDIGFVPDVPPSNSLLLMRNSRNRETLATLAPLPSLLDGHGTDVAQEPAIEGKMLSAASMDTSSKPGSLSSLVVQMGDHQQSSSLSDIIKMEFSPVDNQPVVVKRKAVPHRQVSLPQHTSESSLWQRRCIAKPFDIDVGKPTMVELKRPITT